MKKWFWVLVMLGALLPVPTISAAAEVYGIEIFDYGIYTAVVKKEIKDKNLVGGGFSKIKQIQFIERTTKIPATQNLTFGFQYLIKGRPQGGKIKIRKTTIFPSAGLKNPKTGKTGYKNEVDLTAKIGEKVCEGYRFDEEWEMVPGNWTIQLWYKDRKLAEENFNVYVPQ
ncbi:DUF3859 domain-containing protein [Thermodesulfobacteriota bacterium]